MSSDNLIGIALGVVSLIIAAIFFVGAFAEARRAAKAIGVPRSG
jgi:hypothetical protein